MMYADRDKIHAQQQQQHEVASHEFEIYKQQVKELHQKDMEQIQQLEDTIKSMEVSWKRRVEDWSKKEAYFLSVLQKANIDLATHNFHADSLDLTDPTITFPLLSEQMKEAYEENQKEWEMKEKTYIQQIVQLKQQLQSGYTTSDTQVLYKPVVDVASSNGDASSDWNAREQYYVNQLLQWKLREHDIQERHLKVLEEEKSWSIQQQAQQIEYNKMKDEKEQLVTEVFTLKQVSHR